MSSHPTRSDRRAPLRHAAYGVVATLAGMGLAHLLAALTVPAASPVLAVGSTVIDLTPTPVKEWAVSQFGTADKPILIGSVVVVVLLLAALAGILAARRITVGIGVLVVLAGLATAAALLRPGAGVLQALPGVVAAVTGGAALWWLHRLDADTRPGPESGDTARDGSGRSTGRRSVLLAGGGLAALAVVSGGAGQWISQLRLRPSSVDLPTAAETLDPLPAGVGDRVGGVTPFVTPNDDFYRIDTRLSLPIVDETDWSLTIDGDVDEEVTLTFDDLREMRLVERDITLTCVSNEVGGDLVGGARWLGVPLRDVLDRAGIDQTGADQLLSTDVDGMTISTPLDLALDGRDSLIAIGMNGEALPVAHGFPARMVVPGLYGFISACKWITRITLTTYDEEQAYWTDRDWATDAPIKLSSRIDTPASLAEVEAGETFIGGVAWAQPVGVAKVEVRVDGGPWQEARLGPDGGNDYWRQWTWPWRAEKGQRFLAVRVTDKDGTVQEAARMTPFPEGASGVQEISVTVV